MVEANPVVLVLMLSEVVVGEGQEGSKLEEGVRLCSQLRGGRYTPSAKGACSCCLLPVALLLVIASLSLSLFLSVQLSR